MAFVSYYYMEMKNSLSLSSIKSLRSMILFYHQSNYHSRFSYQGKYHFSCMTWISCISPKKKKKKFNLWDLIHTTLMRFKCFFLERFDLTPQDYPVYGCFSMIAAVLHLTADINIYENRQFDYVSKWLNQNVIFMGAYTITRECL